jgi:methylmalonyl-CoA mutase C-terminal domain/subunit
MQSDNIKIVIATLGLEAHWRGAVTVAQMLREFGVEVVYIGNAFPEEIIEVAIQEDVSIVGVSSLSGGHLTLGSDLIYLARKENIKDKVVFIIGGVFPPNDYNELMNLGFDGIFGTGATGEEIYNFIRKAVTAKLDDSTGNSIA